MPGSYNNGAHESAYIDHLKLQGLAVADLRDVGDERASFARTEEAMRTGVDVIVQAVLATFRRRIRSFQAGQLHAWGLTLKR